MYHWNIKFQEKIFTCKKVIQLWNFGNFGISEIIPKTLVTLRFLKVSLHELESNCKCFQMRYWPIFYIHPTHNSTHFSTWPGRKITNAHDCTYILHCWEDTWMKVLDYFSACFRKSHLIYGFFHACRLLIWKIIHLNFTFTIVSTRLWNFQLEYPK